MEPKKYNPFKGCNCPWCKGSKQIMSRNRSKGWQKEKEMMHRKFRRTGKNIPNDDDYDFPPFLSGNRWY